MKFFLDQQIMIAPGTLFLRGQFVALLRQSEENCTQKLTLT